MHSAGLDARIQVLNPTSFLAVVALLSRQNARPASRTTNIIANCGRRRSWTTPRNGSYASRKVTTRSAVLLWMKRAVQRCARRIITTKPPIQVQDECVPGRLFHPVLPAKTAKMETMENKVRQVLQDHRGPKGHKVPQVRKAHQGRASVRAKELTASVLVIALYRKTWPRCSKRSDLPSTGIATRPCRVRVHIRRALSTTVFAWTATSARIRMSQEVHAWSASQTKTASPIKSAKIILVSLVERRWFD